MCMCSVAVLFVIILVMSVINITSFDMHMYYGAGSKTLGNVLVWLTVVLTVVAMCIVDVTHMYLVSPPPLPSSPALPPCTPSSAYTYMHACRHPCMHICACRSHSRHVYT